MEKRAIPGFSKYLLGDDLVVYRVNGKHLGNGPVSTRVYHGRVTVAVYSDERCAQRIMTRAQLVCRAHHGPPPFPRAHARHLNGDSGDDRPENLAWGTARQNTDDSLVYSPNGYRNAKLERPQVEEILRDRHVQSVVFARRFGVSEATVCRIRKRNRWRWVDEPTAATA